MPKIFRFLFYAFNLLTFCLFILSGWGGHFDPNEFWITSFTSVIFPWVYGVIFFILVINYILNNKNWVILFSICLIVGWFSFNRYYKIPHYTKTDNTSLNVLTYNLFGQRKIKNKNKSILGKNRSAFLSFIKEQGDIDVFLFQEYNFKTDINYITNGLDLRNQVKFKKSGIAILTNHDVLEKGIITFKDTGNAAIWADLKIDDKIIRFYSMHLQSNQVSGLAGEVTHDGDVRDQKTRSKIKKMIQRVKKGASMRADQIKIVKEHISKCPYPIVIGGDMNETPWSYPYMQITQNFQDAFYVNGSGSGISYGGDIPGLKIDYIFVDPKIKVLESYVAKSRFSDHYPQIAKLKLD